MVVRVYGEGRAWDDSFTRERTVGFMNSTLFSTFLYLVASFTQLLWFLFGLERVYGA